MGLQTHGGFTPAKATGHNQKWWLAWLVVRPLVLTNDPHNTGPIWTQCACTWQTFKVVFVGAREDNSWDSLNVCHDILGNRCCSFEPRGAQNRPLISYFRLIFDTRLQHVCERAQFAAISIISVHSPFLLFSCLRAASPIYIIFPSFHSVFHSI